MLCKNAILNKRKNTSNDSFALWFPEGLITSCNSLMIHDDGTESSPLMCLKGFTYSQSLFGKKTLLDFMNLCFEAIAAVKEAALFQT